MRILLWHGWLLEGSGSNIYAARTAEVFAARQGHQVWILCQEPDADRYDFIRATGTIGRDGVHSLRELPRSGRIAETGAVLLRPDIGSLLPVFVIDEYEGFTVKRFVDLTDDELEAYLRRNVEALRAAAEEFAPDIVITGHAVPGAVVGRRALGPGGYVAKIHGSDLEYAIRPQERYRALAAEGLSGARAVIGATHELLDRAHELVPAPFRGRVVAPGVDSEVFRRMSRSAALEQAVSALESEPDAARGRRDGLDVEVKEAVERRDAKALDDLALRYDQAAPDQGAAERLRSLLSHEGPLVGYFGKLIPQKGVDLLLAATPSLDPAVRVVIVGFGGFREWLTALVLALDAGDSSSVRWIEQAADLRLGLQEGDLARGKGMAGRVVFTGRLDHRFAPFVLAALDVLVVPSVLREAFGMVAAEGAAAGALPLVARHSGLAEVGTALEAVVGQPGLFSFEPGPGAPARIAEGINRLLAIPAQEGEDLRQKGRRFVATEWTWERTAEGLLAAGRAVPS